MQARLCWRQGNDLLNALNTMPAKKRPMRAVVLLAGLGTRLLPLSRVIPKEFVPIGAKPVIQRIVEECYEAGIREVIFVVNTSNKSIIQKYFNAEHATHMHAVTHESARAGVLDLYTLMQK